MSTLRRTVCTALLSALLALPLAACGGGDPVPDEQPAAEDPPPEPTLQGDEDTPERLELEEGEEGDDLDEGDDVDEADDADGGIDDGDGGDDVSAASWQLA